MKLWLATFSHALVGTGCMLAAASGSLAQTRQFQGWVAGCDNAHVCIAIVFAEPSKAVAEPGIPFLQIRHHPLTDVAPVIRVLDPGPAGENGSLAKEEARLVATPSGAEVAKGPDTYTPEYDGKGGFRFMDGQSWSILHALRSGYTIRISIGKKQNLRLLTPGLDGVLGYFDDQQELADTPGALIRKPKGELTDYAHPRPPDVDTIEAVAFGEPVHSDIARKALPAAPRCASPQPDAHVQGYPLRGSATLLRSSCAADGTNEISAWHLVPRTGARPTLHRWHNGSDDKRADGALLSNAEVLPNGGIVRSVRFRAPTRDCGVSERWGWTREGRFLLAERREMPLCRTAGPAHWIITYRADLVTPN